MSNGVFAIVVPAAIILVLILTIGLIIGRLYKRSTRETSIVRTGAGGRRVVVDGGCIVIPMLHDLLRVNMMTLRLEVQRNAESSLITKDRMRVDATVEFYVRVQSTEEGIARAAQTLGQKTFAVEDLREMIEGKLVDGLRAVSAQMTMDDLHEQRSHFVQQVQQAVAEDLVKNGLELESVSLTALDQTPFEGLDEQNAFNAVGMRRLAEVIASERRARAQVEADARVAIERTEQEAGVKVLEIERLAEDARVGQSIKLAQLKANEVAELARRQEESIQASESAKIERETKIEAAQIARQQEIETARIASERALELSRQERAIAVAQKSEAESQARAAADAARAEAVKSEESIITERAVAEAERSKRIELLKAEESAEKAATAIRVAARAEREAAEDRAAAVLAQANAEADAIKIRADADKDRALAEAKGRRELLAAENSTSPEIIAYKIAMERLSQLPAIIREMVAPAHKIESIRVHQINGVPGAMASGGAAGAGTAGDAAGSRNAIDQVYDAITGMALQMPMLQAMGRSVGISFGDGVAGILKNEMSEAESARDKTAGGQPDPK